VAPGCPGVGTPPPPPLRHFLRTLLVGVAAALCAATAQEAHGQRVHKETFTHADTLRGTITPERAWWDVTFYDLHVSISPADSSVRGWNSITYRVVSAPRPEMQIDLQVPLVMDSVVQDGHRLTYRRDGNAYFVAVPEPGAADSERTVTAFYHGRPRVAKRPPWDGGFTWSRDSLGHPWIANTDQGLGASVWWPNKDTQADEPDSQRIAITVPDSMMDVSNGRLRHRTRNGDGTTTYEWFVQNPINNYDVAVNIGAYAHIAETYAGLKGPLTLDFWPLAYHRDAAAAQFQQAKSMLACFESWFGPYPWYTDGYKLIEAPHLGMEHQSAVAYGNHYHNGYLGIDLSGTGWGLKWDFIIVHESAHEWFGNSLTTADVADMWVHESFANYAEALYTECLFGKEAGAEYVRGTRARVVNDEPIVGHYGVNNEGSGDMYYKGGNMLHTIRQIIGNDSTWHAILLGLNTTFWHQIVTGQQVQHYISQHAGIDLSHVFEQYLTTTRIPEFEYATYGGTLRYRWSNVVPGFNMPVRVTLAPGRTVVLTPSGGWQSLPLPRGAGDTVQVDPNYFVTSSRLDAPPRCMLVCRQSP
jgi:aminopeptidase N